MADTKKVKKNLDVMLTHAELAAYSETLAIEVQNVCQLRNEKKVFDKRIGDAIKEKEKEVSDTAKIVFEKKEMREVECLWEYDWNRNVKVLTRLDTYEVVESRVIPANDRQLYLDGIKKAEEDQMKEAAVMAEDSTDSESGPTE